VGGRAFTFIVPFSGLWISSIHNTTQTLYCKGMNILLILQLAVTLLLNVSTGQATVEQKQQALSFAVQAVQIANTYIVENASSTLPVNTGGDNGGVIQAPITQSVPPVIETQPITHMPSFTVEVLESVSAQGGYLKFKVTDSQGKPVAHINHIESPLTYQNFNGLGEDNGIYQIRIPEQTSTVENPTLNVTVNGEEVKVPVTIQ
jgi:hypothetical protein